MRIVMLGLNHRTAPVALREQLAMPSDRLTAFLAQLRTDFPDAQFVVLSTCNRTEIYTARPSHAPPCVDDLRAALAHQGNISVEDITAATIHREQEQAIAHLFRVCSGLDSMVLGETQILGQIKRAYETARDSDAVGPVLHKVFQSALSASRKVRAQTGIDAGRVSVGSVAVDFARQVFDDFSDKTIVGIGAGEMAKITLTHLRDVKPKRLWLINRTPDKAIELAQSLGLDANTGGPRAWDELDALLIEADVIVTSTGATEPIITAQRFKPLLRKRRNRPLFLIDIAVPRDVEQAVGGLSNVYLYNVDDLESVIAATHGQRQELVTQCNTLLADHVAACVSQLQNQDVGRLVRELRRRLMDIGDLERQRSGRKLAQLNGDAAQAQKILDEHTHRLINKILHLPLSQLDHANPDAPLGFYAAALRRLFDLEDRPASSSTLRDMSKNP